VYTYIHIEIYVYICCRFKREKENKSPGDFAESVPFAHRPNESLSFVRLLTKKQTEDTRL
jgi:hypothetical protein